MRINHNIAALNTYRQLTVNNGSTAKNLEKLSSGLRINRAGDDAAGLSISEKMRGQIRGLEQASRNSQDGISLIQTAEGALSSVSDMLIRVKELATQAANGTNVPTEDLARIQEEVDQISLQITDVMDNTNFNGINLIDNTADVVLQVGEASTQTLTLDAATMDISLVDTAVAAYDLSTQAGATLALADIENQINAISAKRSYLGANQNRLETNIKNLDTNAENLTAAESRIRDVDMAKEMMEFTKNNILSQAAQSMLAQANQQPQGVLQLLR
ncbi:flagellin [Fictibacillus sp. NPDC058756]|uniref:flagellin N-terminal helical domain-containing protein n=1 Tax=Fictibacillus sp. NPDC058756 TaxID=3346625 RepID=UPI00369DA9AB